MTSRYREIKEGGVTLSRFNIFQVEMLSLSGPNALLFLQFLLLDLQ